MNIITIEVMGGLGNNLFQIATAYALSVRDGMELIIDNSHHYSSPHGPFNIYLNNILRNFKVIYEPLNFPTLTHAQFEYKEIPKFDHNLKLLGHYQSWKYFDDYKKEIQNLLSPSDQSFDIIYQKYENFLKEKNCSIHIRRGDYLHFSEHHPTLPIQYYIDATNIIGKNNNYLIFSDDIEWCKNNFDFIKNKTFVEGLNDYDELHMMSMCNDNIIANSTFSWWGSYLNKNNNKTIAPQKWFGSGYSSYRLDDLYCKDWVII